MSTEIATEQFSAALDRLAAKVLREAGIEGPPVNALELAARLELTVAVDDGQSGRARCVRLTTRSRAGAKGAILVRSEERVERRQWAVAHEIGEHFAARVFCDLGIDLRDVAPAARERVANQLAGRLLLPAAWFGADAAACDWDLPALKALYATASHELIARRMLEFPPPIVVTIFDQGRVTLRRGNLHGRSPPLSPLERDCWRAVHSTGLPDERAAHGVHVRGWPVHEAYFKREILRTSIEIDLIDDEPADPYWPGD